MLHKDSPRRISELLATVDLFGAKGYNETAKAVLEFKSLLEGTQVPVDTLKRILRLFDTYQSEFVDSHPIGKIYRKGCFEEVKSAVLHAISKKGVMFAQTILPLHPSLVRLAEARRTTSSIGEETRRTAIKDRFIIFHLLCYSYLIIVEGMFDEASRILYFLTELAKGNIVPYQVLQNMETSKINKMIKPTPIFLKDWEDKKHIRNAIGHASASYDPSKGEATFVDRKWRSTMPMSRFIEMAMELEDTIEAFAFVFIIIRINDLIYSRDPYAT